MTFNWKITERFVALFVFVWATVLYLLTVAPTASFWDSGEFIAIANRLQVSHPPGAPFYMLVGRLFSMFVPTAYVSLSVNLVSVFASSFTILLTHLIIVRIAREWQSSDNPSTIERISVLAGGVIGSLTFAATDSFWFNAVEAEVYAFSMFFTAVVVWLILKWSEQARREEATLSKHQTHFGLSANRYLVLIAYMFGLAIGVHLLNLLAIFFIALVYYFVEYDRHSDNPKMLWIGILITGIISTAAFLIVYPGIIQLLPTIIGVVAENFESLMGASAANQSVIATIILGLAIIVGALYYTQTRKMQIANLVVLCITVVMIGYSTYALIFIRSAADPPIDENDPETVEAFISYLKREQYGETPIFKGYTFDNETRNIDTSQEVLFPRRHSPSPIHLQQYGRYRSDGHFFFEYQIRKMYIRYFLWNFVGRGSDIQDAEAITGFSFIDDPQYHKDRYVQTPSERASRNAYFALPFLLGLFGAIFHFFRDWRRAFSVFVLFFVTGIGIILYLNQTPLQPRERDYSYVASFFAFSLWIGIGATGLLQIISELFESASDSLKKNAPAILLGISAILFLAVPLWMTIENYDDHDRSGRYIAPEYAHNMLMSVDDDAILITNGDNDTFPLWYLQEVEGVRQDVRVVNVSLLNTPWYINQLKNQASRDSEPLPFTMPDDAVEDLQIQGWQPQTIELPVELPPMLESSELPIAIDDTSIIESPMRWTLTGRPYNDDFNLLYIADQALLDMVITNAREGWKRPFYFAVTVSDDGQLDLQNYFQLEGQAFRVVPIQHNEPLGRVSTSITPEKLKNFKFTNLNNPDVYYDENIRRMVDNYRNIYVQTVQTLVQEGMDDEAQEIMDILMTNVPFETIPGVTPRSHLIVARAYQLLGDQDNAMNIWGKAEPLVLQGLSSARTQYELERSARFMQMIEYGYLEVGNLEAASTFRDKIAEAMEDESYKKTPEEFEIDRRRLFPPPASEETDNSGE